MASITAIFPPQLLLLHDRRSIISRLLSYVTIRRAQMFPLQAICWRPRYCSEQQMPRRPQSIRSGALSAMRQVSSMRGSAAYDQVTCFTSIALSGQICAPIRASSSLASSSNSAFPLMFIRYSRRLHFIGDHSDCSGSWAGTCRSERAPQRMSRGSARKSTKRVRISLRSRLRGGLTGAACTFRSGRKLV